VIRLIRLSRLRVEHRGEARALRRRPPCPEQGPDDDDTGVVGRRSHASADLRSAAAGRYRARDDRGGITGLPGREDRARCGRCMVGVRGPL